MRYYKAEVFSAIAQYKNLCSFAQKIGQYYVDEYMGKVAESWSFRKIDFSGADKAGDKWFDVIFENYRYGDTDEFYAEMPIDMLWDDKWRDRIPELVKKRKHDIEMVAKAAQDKRIKSEQAKERREYELLKEKFEGKNEI